MASVATGAHMEKLSYSKIAASGLKPQSTQQNSNNAETTQNHDIASHSRDSTHIVSPSNGANPSASTSKQKRLVPFSPKDTKEAHTVVTHGPQVHVQKVDTTSPIGRIPRALDGMLMPTSTDEAGTQISSSSGSGKPPSLDGKSVTSGTTYALDEKESLRPDDSASVKATEDEEALTPLESGQLDSRTGSDVGVRAFRDQLREISSMEPARAAGAPQTFAHSAGQVQGVLYMPPQGLGVGTVPGAGRVATPADRGMDLPPDSKLLEALDSPKDRIMVLKLEQDIVDFVKDARESSLKLPQTNAFYRMLAHKLADYYMLGHIFDESTMALRIFKTANCRLPPPLTGIATPSTAASTPPPYAQQMKILRRGGDKGRPTIANGSRTPSKTTSENGDSGNDEDKRPKLPPSREEREAKYEAARKRIMGSAKPSDSPEEPLQKDESRSSSAAGRRTNRKKQRADSDDDFEARSAYSAYYPQAFTAAGPTPTSFGYPSIVESRSGQLSPAPYGNQDPAANYSTYGATGNNAWSAQSYQPGDATPNWMQNPQAGYDLCGDFQRTMNINPMPMPNPSPYMQPNFSAPYQHQLGGPQQPWTQQPPYAGGYPIQQGGPNYVHGYPNPAHPAPNQLQEPASYQFGQLPSQAYPGRAPSRLEHPLPGSYKSKHFNPQSQTFIPGHASPTSPQQPTLQALPVNSTTYGNGYGMPGFVQAKSPLPHHSHAAVSSQQATPNMSLPRAPSQPMTHPLPQPVFPCQPSPNVPLPPKPEATPPKHFGNSTPHASSSSSNANQGQSSIAKWGTPASLPAKPPPSAEPFDPARFTQRQPSQGSTRPANSMPSFGSMPPMLGGFGVTGQPPRRV
ncbi:hypothetical protein LTR37_012578 [Vermiconidia calcicola]|uniref:Uncharacterized protein n=1 Tax=Vermiconidia calcicola TaxID=1690605 RepID=A0ACC3MYU8_9PEZI|nr:hypothetical protein LTR37_012578 [Vermiconidia calcicola]